MATKPSERKGPTSDDEIESAVYRATPAGTVEVADLVGLTRQATEYRLNKLKDGGPIWTKKIGPTRIWLHEKIVEK